MRHSIKRISKRALSIVIALMMVVSTMLVGMVTTSAASTYYYRGADNSWGTTAMTPSADGYYAYYETSTNNHQFKISISTSSYDYGWTYVQAGFNSTDVTSIGDYSNDNCYCYHNKGRYYILLYYPNTKINSSSNPIICASTTLPDSTPAWYLMGGAFGKWETENKSAKMTLDEKSGNYYYDVSATNLDMLGNNDNAYFRFHDGTRQYGPQFDNDLDVSNDGVKAKIAENSSKAIHYSGSEPKNIKIWLDPTNMQVWIETTVLSYDLKSNPEGSGTVKFEVNGSEVTQAQAGDRVTVKAAPSSGFYLKSITSDTQDVTVSKENPTFTMPEGAVTIKVEFEVIIKSVTLTADKTKAFVGEPVTLTPEVQSAFKETDVYSTSYTVTKDGNPVEGLIVNDVFTPDGVGSYAIVYTAKVTNPAATVDSLAVNITVTETAEQAAYTWLTENLQLNTDYSDAYVNSNQYMAASYAKYKEAYEAAKACIEKEYPAYNSASSECQTAKENLDIAYEALTKKEKLLAPQVELKNASGSASDGIITAGEEITIKVSNFDEYSKYPDGSYKFVLKSGGSALSVEFVDGELKVGYEDMPNGAFTVVAEAVSEDYYDSDPSSPFTVNSVPTYDFKFADFSNATVSYTYTDAHNKQVTVTDKTAVSKIPANSNVTVTFNVNANYKLTEVTAAGATLSVNGNVCTFNMPASDVTVTPLIAEKVKYTVSAYSADSAQGTVSVTPSGAQYEGTTVTVTAAAKEGYAFKAWEIVRGTRPEGVTLTNPTLSFVPNADVELRATFEENKGVQVDNCWLLYTDKRTNDPQALTKYLPVYDVNGEYIAYFNDLNLSAGKSYSFLISSRNDSYDGHFWKNNQPTVTENPVTEAVIAGNENNYSLYGVNYFNGYVEIKQNLESLAVCVGKGVNNSYLNSKMYEVRAKEFTLPEGTGFIYAKDGVNVENGTSTFGTTVVEAANSSSEVNLYQNHSTDGYNIYTSEAGNIVKVTTTVTASGKYVAGFVVNGKTTYLATEGKNNTYYAEIPIEEGIKEYEITPVYYDEACRTDGQFIKFYVNDDEMKANGFDWGGSVYCYGYYYYKHENSNDGIKHYAYSSDGNYPGQPMLYDDTVGMYYCYLPKTIQGFPISGITMNNGFNDGIHKDIKKLSVNAQTFDFNDLKYLADLDFDIIRFNMKPRKSYDNYNKTVGYWSGDQGVTSINPKSIYSSDLSGGTFANGWETFLTGDSLPGDVLGYETESSDKTVYVVSVGSINSSQDTSFNGKQDYGVGQWSTEWILYDSDGKVITHGKTSDFISRTEEINSETLSQQMPAFRAYYDWVCRNNDGKYVAYDTKITFETERTYDNGNTTRLDGDWLFATYDSEVSADVTYRLDGVLQEPNAAYAMINGTETSVTYENRSENITVAAKPLTGYIFKGWSVADVDADGNYSNFIDLPSSLGASFTTPLDSTTHYVANYIKATAGSLVLSHYKYDAPDALGGLGYYYITAQVVNADGDVIKTVNGTGSGANGQNLMLQNITNEPGFKVVVTIKTVTGGENTFVNWYTASTSGYEIIGDPDGGMYCNGEKIEDPTGLKGTLEYTFEIETWKLFSSSGNQLVNEMNYYSDIAPVTKDAVLNYKYYNRFGEERTYTVTIKLSDEYLDKNGYKITNDLIYSNAPAINDIYKNCTWKIDNQQITVSGTNVILWGVHTDVTYDVILNDTVNPEATGTVKLNDYFKDASGKFYEAAAKDVRGVPFAYWTVYDRDAEKEVAKCYSRQFNLKIAGNYTITAVYEEEITDSLTISDPTYSREQFTDETGSVVTDYLYVDFIVAYMGANGDLLKGNPNYKTGLIIEFNKNEKIDPDKNPDEFNNNKLDKPIEDYAYDAVTENWIEQLAKDDDIANNTIQVNGNSAAIKYEINSDKYNNKNRLDYILKFNNSASYRHYVMKAYYYVIYTDPDTKEVKYMVTDPSYFCMYEIGNSSAATEG